MEIEIILYGIARDIFGAPKHKMNIASGVTVNQVMASLRNEYAELSKLSSLMIAINDEYASGDEEIKDGDEIVLIPPVSGG